MRRGWVVTRSAKVREPRVLAEEMAALCAESKRSGSSFSRGALDALQWLTEGGPGPLTRRVAQKPIMVCAAIREVAVAEGKIYGRDLVESRYAQGVLHALMWAQYTTALPPVRLESRSVAVVDHRARIADHAAG
jgi:hypothetical protein